MLCDGPVPELVCPNLFLEVPRSGHLVFDLPQGDLNVLDRDGLVIVIPLLKSTESISVVVIVALENNLEVNDLRAVPIDGVVETDLHGITIVMQML